MLQQRGAPLKRGALGSCPFCPCVNPALNNNYYYDINFVFDVAAKLGPGFLFKHLIAELKRTS